MRNGNLGWAMSLIGTLVFSWSSVAPAQELELPGKVHIPTPVVVKSDPGCPQALEIKSGLGKKDVPVIAFSPRSFKTVYTLKRNQYALTPPATKQLLAKFKHEAEKKFRFHCIATGAKPMGCQLNFKPAGAASAKVDEVQNLSSADWTFSDLPNLRRGQPGARNSVVFAGKRPRGYVDSIGIFCTKKLR